MFRNFNPSCSFSIFDKATSLGSDSDLPLLRHSQHRFDRYPANRVRGRLIDRGKFIEGNEAVDRKLPADEKIDQMWDELIRPAVALDDAAHGAARP